MGTAHRGAFAASLDEDVSLFVRLAFFRRKGHVKLGKSQLQLLHDRIGRGTNLQGILAREALLAVAARERFDRQVDPLVPLQVVVSVEALRALVALEGPVVLLLLLLLALVAVHVLPAHLVRVLHAHAPDERHLVARAVHIGHDGSRHGWEAVPVVRARVEAPHRGVVR